MWGDEASQQMIGVGTLDAILFDGVPSALGRRASIARPRAFERPEWRGRMHTWAFFATLPAGLALVAAAEATTSRVAAIVYVTTLLAVFGTSAAYHRLTRTERSRLVMQRLDHSMIYLLIAGTYTPLCLVALPRAWGIPVLVSVGLMGATGVVLKLVAFDRFRRLSYALYPAMGWVAVVAAPAMFAHLTTAELWLMFAGGLAYSVGLPVLMIRRPDPWPSLFGYHEVWHVLTIVAAGLHFAAVGNVVA